MAIRFILLMAPLFGLFSASIYEHKLEVDELICHVLFIGLPLSLGALLILRFGISIIRKFR